MQYGSGYGDEMPTSKLTSADLQRLLAEEKRIAMLAIQDEDNKRLMFLAVTAGTISSLALAHLYVKLTPDTTDDVDIKKMIGTGLMAIGSGLVWVTYKTNMALFNK